MEYYVNVKTQEEYDKLMEILEGKGYKWNSGDKPTKLNIWYKYKKETTIHVREEYLILFGNTTRLQNKKVFTLEEYKKGIYIKI